MNLKEVKISAIQPDTYADREYFSYRNELLIGKGSLITERLISLLRRRNVFELYVKVSHEEDVLNIIASDFKHLESIEDDTGFRPDSVEYYENLSTSNVVAALDKQLAGNTITDSPIGIPFKSTMSQISVQERNEDYVDDVHEMYKKTLKRVQSTITSLIRGERQDIDRIYSLVKKLAKIFLTDRNILLNISNMKPDENEHLYHHSLNVCILSMNIAASYGFNEEQIIEIGAGALLHDIGMFLVPEEIRRKHGRFTKDEWYEIKKHPILGLHLLEMIKDLPDSVLLIAYQTHERLNSSGYPKMRGTNLIHKFAKVVQVADIYEAMSSPRPHREASIPFKSAGNLIKMSFMDLISKDVVKAFIIYMTSYPIGSLVQLSNDCIAKVVDTANGAISKPIVTVLTDPSGNLLPTEKMYQINTAEDYSITIVKAVSPYHLPNVGIMDGFYSADN